MRCPADALAKSLGQGTIENKARTHLELTPIYKAPIKWQLACDVPWQEKSHREVATATSHQ